MRLEDFLTKKPIEPEIEKLPEYLETDPELVGYPDEEMQRRIYKWAVHGLDIHNSKFLDVGAGRADIYEKELFNCAEYCGIETKVGLCKVAEKYRTNPNFSILNDDYLNLQITEGYYDYVLCIGTLNEINNTVEKWDNFLKYFNKMYAECKSAVILILSNMFEDENLNFYPISELFDIALSADRPVILDYSQFEGIYKLIAYKV